MDSVNIGTSQNVAIKYDVANIGDRFLALLIDQFVIIGLSLGILTLANTLINLLNITWQSTFYVLFLPLFFYHFISELTMDGQSIGKKARKIKVMKKDGGSASFGNYFLRFLLRPIDSFYGIGLLVILINGKGQRLGDLAAGTAVVKLKNRVKLTDLIHTNVDENYQPVFPEVVKLTDKDVGIIKSILVTRKRNQHHQNIEALALKIQEVINAKTSDISPFEFLEQVLKDYNFYHRGH